MRITDILVDRATGLLRIQTDEKHEGWCPDVPPEAAEPLVERFSSMLCDQDPIDRERLWSTATDIDKRYSAPLRGYVDVALWDLAAKNVGLPLYRYISGFRNRIPACNRGVEELDGEPVVQEARRAQRDGFPAYKITCDLSVERLLWLIPEVRQWVGEDFCLILEGNQSFTLRDAITVGRCLDAANGFLFERVRPAGDFSGIRQVASAIDTPVAIDVSTLTEAAQTFALEAADSLRTSISAGVGITDALKMARCAEAFGAHIHLAGQGIAAGFAHAHLLGAIRNAPFFEAEENGIVPCCTNIRNPLHVENGHLTLPGGPGLGIELE